MTEAVPEAISWIGETLSVRVLFSCPGVAQQVWLGYDDGGLLLDTGDGCLRDLLASDYRPRILGGLVFTHGHFDHMGGLHSLLGYLRMIGRTKPLPVVGPSGCTELWGTVAAFQRCYAGSIPFEIACKEMDDREVVEIDGLKVQAFSVVHCGSIASGTILELIPAMGYRISLGRETVAITGDTGNCDSLQELVAGADLAIIEGTYPESSAVDPELSRKVHLSEDLAREIGKLAKRYVLVHRGRPTREK